MFPQETHLLFQSLCCILCCRAGWGNGFVDKLHKLSYVFRHPFCTGVGVIWYYYKVSNYFIAVVNCLGLGWVLASAALGTSCFLFVFFVALFLFRCFRVFSLGWWSICFCNYIFCHMLFATYCYRFGRGMILIRWQLNHCSY